MDFFVLHVLSDILLYVGILSILPERGVLMSAISILIPIAYVAVCVIFARKNLHLENLRNQYMVELGLYFLILFILRTGDIVTWQYFTFGMASILLKIINLRLIRMGTGAGIRERAWNIGMFLGALVVSLVLGFLIYEIFTHAYYFFDILGLLGGAIIILISKIMMKLGVAQFLFSDDPRETATGNVNPGYSGGVTEEVKPPPISVQDHQQDLIFQKVVIAIFCIILLLIAFFVIRKMVRVFFYGKYEDSAIDGVMSIKKEDGKRRHRKGKASNKDAIRMIYIEYLKYIRKRGIYLSISNTSMDVLGARGVSDEESPEYKLRALYISIRYQDESKVTSEEVNLAKQYWEEIQKLEKQQ